MGENGELPQSRASALQIGGRPCRVLVVDDQPQIHILAKHYIEQAGGVVVAAQNGREALDREEQCRQDGQPVDLILLDMQMPVMDGYATADKLRACGFQRPIIALTARALPDDREKCLAAGCDEYATKPFDGERLVALIAQFTQDTSPDQLIHRRKDRSQQAASATVPPQRPAGAAAKVNHRHVLVVDDSRDMCKLMEILLTRRGHTVTSAFGGREALEVARSSPPDVVLMDIGLPGMDGYEVAQLLRQIPAMRDALLIALSGRGEPEARLRSAQAGFDHHLTKPADMDLLERLLEGEPR